MSKSYKKAVFKDNGMGKDILRRQVRNSLRNYMRSNIDKFLDDDCDVNIPDEKTVTNDYDWCDYRFYHEHANKKNRDNDKWYGIFRRK